MLQKQYTEQKINILSGEARYHLGRVLYESERDFDRAISELENAIRIDSENARAYYYLGQAIRAQIEHNMEKRAQDAFRTYLKKGTLLGHEDEVREYLGARKKAAENR